MVQGELHIRDNIFLASAKNVFVLCSYIIFFFFFLETFFFDGNLKKDIRATESKTDWFNFDILTL